MDRLYGEFGRLVRERRLKAHLTQSQLAKRVGLSRTSITNIELGQQHIPLHVLYPLASALGASPHELLPDPAHAVANATTQIDAELAALLTSAALPRSMQTWVERHVTKTSIERTGGQDAIAHPRTSRSKSPRRSKNK